MVTVAALIVHHAESAVCKLLDGALDSLIIGYSPAHDLHLRAVQRPLVSPCIGQHGSPVVQQKAHGAGQVLQFFPGLLIDGPGILYAHHRLWLGHACQINEVGIISLVPLHHLVQQLVQLLP